MAAHGPAPPGAGRGDLLALVPRQCLTRVLRRLPFGIAPNDPAAPLDASAPLLLVAPRRE